MQYHFNYITPLTFFQQLKPILIAIKRYLNYNYRNVKRIRRDKMIDVNLIRTNPDLVRENIRKKFQDNKLQFVD